jgi:hypothetical protein
MPMMMYLRISSPAFVRRSCQQYPVSVSTSSQALWHWTRFQLHPNQPGVDATWMARMPA